MLTSLSCWNFIIRYILFSFQYFFLDVKCLFIIFTIFMSISIIGIFCKICMLISYHNTRSIYHGLYFHHSTYHNITIYRHRFSISIWRAYLWSRFGISTIWCAYYTYRLKQMNYLVNSVKHSVIWRACSPLTDNQYATELAFPSPWGLIIVLR